MTASIRNAARSAAAGLSGGRARPGRAKPLPRELALLPDIAKGAREAIGVSQRELADVFGCSQIHVRRLEDPDAERYVRTDYMVLAGREYTLHVCREMLAMYGYVALPNVADLYGDNDATRVIALGRAFDNAHRAGAALVLEGPPTPKQLELFVRENDRAVTALCEASQNARRRLRAKKGER